jgi:hypothetical protein
MHPHITRCFPDIVSASHHARVVELLLTIPSLPFSRDVVSVLASFFEEAEVTTVASPQQGLDAPNGVAVDAAAGCLCKSLAIAVHISRLSDRLMC